MKRVSAPLLIAFASLLGWLNPSGNSVYAQYYDCSVTCSTSVPTVGAVGSPLQFSATAQPYYCTGPPAYSWDFGNGRNSALPNPTNTYQSPGTYSWGVTVTVDGVSAAQGGLITITHRAVTSVSAASYEAAGLGSESIAAAFGASLGTSTQVATTVPLPTEIAGVRVRVKDAVGTERLAPLFFVSPAQINYQIPPGTSAGMATVTIINGSETVAQGDAPITSTAPGLFTANSSGQGVPAALVLRVKADGTQILEPVADFDAGQSRFVPHPIDLGPATDQVFLIVFGTGIRNVSTLAAVTASIGGVGAEVLFAGPQGAFVGLDQANLRLPRSLAGRGEVDLGLVVSGKAANIVKLNIR